MAEVLFFLAAIGAVAGAVGTVSLRNPFYAVLALVCHLLALAALFLLLRAEFVAAAQVVVYAGAVMVLYVFVVAYVGGQARAEHRDAQLQEERAREDHRRGAQARAAAGGERLILAADVGDDEDVEHHHGARVHDDLGGGDELGAQQQEQRREREQVADERQHGVERVAQRHRADGTGDRTDRGQEEEHLCHCGP